MIRVVVATVTSLLLAGCGDDGGGGSRVPPTPADLRFTDLFVQNQSGGDIEVRWVSFEGFQTSGIIANGTRSQIDEASQNFDPPLPSQGLTYIEVTDGTRWRWPTFGRPR